MWRVLILFCAAVFVSQSHSFIGNVYYCDVIKGTRIDRFGDVTTHTTDAFKFQWLAENVVIRSYGGDQGVGLIDTTSKLVITLQSNSVVPEDGPLRESTLRILKDGDFYAETAFSRTYYNGTSSKFHFTRSTFNTVGAFIANCDKFQE